MVYQTPDKGGENICFEDTLCPAAGFNKHAFLLPESIPLSPSVPLSLGRVRRREQRHSQLFPICPGQIYMALYG